MAKKRAKKKKPSRRARSKKRTVKKKVVKRKRAAARKKTAKKKTARRKSARKKTTKKKAAKKRTAKKKTTKRKTVRKTKKKTARRASRRSAPRKTAGFVRQPAPAAAPPKPAIPGESPVGTVIHYYSHLSVAVVRMDSGSLNVGETIHIKGHTTDFKQRVESMEIEHGRIPTAVVGQEFGLKVIDHAREHDQVYKVG